MKDQTKIQLKEEFESYIKKNALGLVCECGGGGTTDDNNTCKKCGGCGVYEWRVHNIEEVFDKIYNSLLQSQRESLVEKIEKMRAYTNPINKDSRLIDKSEVLALINQNN